MFGDAAENASWLDARTATNALSRAGVIVDAVWSKADYRGNQPVDVTLGPLAREDYVKPTGGMIFDATAPDLGLQLFRRIQEIRASYVLTYAPTEAVLRDGWHPLSVKLKNRKGQVRARSGYFSGPAVRGRR